MSRRLSRAVHDWLCLEKADAEYGADRALLEVFSCLPPAPIPVGFADRVLRRAGLVPAPWGLAVGSLEWAVRVVVGLSFVMGGLFLLLLPDLLPAVLGIVNPGRMVELGVGAAIGLAQRLGAGLLVWKALSDIGGVITSSLSSPAYLGAILLTVLLAAGAFRVLHSLILSERSSRYVGSY